MKSPNLKSLGLVNKHRKIRGNFWLETLVWLQNAGWIFLDSLLSGIKGLLSTKQERMCCLKATAPFLLLSLSWGLWLGCGLSPKGSCEKGLVLSVAGWRCLKSWGSGKVIRSETPHSHEGINSGILGLGQVLEWQFLIQTASLSLTWSLASCLPMWSFSSTCVPSSLMPSAVSWHRWKAFAICHADEALLTYPPKLSAGRMSCLYKGSGTRYFIITAQNRLRRVMVFSNSPSNATFSLTTKKEGQGSLGWSGRDWLL